MKTKKILSYLLTATTLISTILPSFAATNYKDSIASEEHQHIEENLEASNTTVYAEIGSTFKVTIPKHIILDGTTKSGVYTVSVEGDISGDESIWVVPDSYFRLSSINKNDILAFIEQDKVNWTFNELNSTANGLIETENMTAGSWNGNFNFNISLETSTAIYAVATTFSNETSEIEAINVSGDQKNILTQALIESNLVEEGSSYDLLIKIKDIDDDTNKIDFNVINVADPGDSALILEEENGDWAYVYEKITSNNRTMQINYQKIPVIEGDHIHTYTEEIQKNPTCTEDGTLLYKCTGEDCNLSVPFSIPATHNLEVVEKKDENGELINKYYECTNCTYSILNLTKLFSGEELSHDCNDYAVTAKNESKHWQYCAFCKRIISESAHNFNKTSWTLGTASCAWGNGYTSTCSCGQSITGYRPCVWDGKSYGTSPNSLVHYKVCSVCGGHISKGYYTGTYGKGSITTYNPNTEQCRTTSTNLIECGETGTCKICKYQYTTAAKHVLSDGRQNGTTSNIYCTSCNKVFGTTTTSYKRTNTSTPGTYQFTTVFNLKNGAVYDTESMATKFAIRNNGGAWDTTTYSHTISKKNTALTQVTIVQKATMNLTYKQSYGAYLVPNLLINGVRTQVTVGSYICNADYTKPAISKITLNDLATLNDWSTGKQITITGTENYTNTVTVVVTNSAGTQIFKGTAPVTNKNYSITFIPDIEENEAKTYTVSVTDACQNTTTKTFSISKTDNKKPIVNNINSSTEWSQTKEVLFTATDQGSGDVQIAFNNAKELFMPMTKNGTTYTKVYQFSGDVYGEIAAAIYYKDAVGNVETQFIKVHNLDNTAPTILNVDENGNSLTVLANDLNQELGLEGSGIDSYAITWTSAPPQESDWQESNIFNIPKGGIYYLWAKDAVGNVSEGYKVQILL